MDKKKIWSNRWWAPLIISIIGTAIGVGLTFAVNNWMDKRQKQQTQRLMAMMVIHDIDESINYLKNYKEEVETMYYTTMYVRNHLSELESLPTDTLFQALKFIVNDEEDFRFDMSKEKIFHSSPDIWQNLGSMKFIDNVQSFYFDRQTFQNIFNRPNLWQEPVPLKETECLMIGSNNSSLEEYYELYYNKLREFLKEKLADAHVNYFIDYTPQRIGVINTFIKEWSMMNDENKFLMSITDEELENYVNSFNTNGIAVKDKNLIGTWSSSSSDELNQFEFRKDHTYSFTSNETSAANINFSQGKLTRIYIETGTWKLKGDSLFAKPDSVDYKLDASKMTVQPEKREMLDNWVQNYQKESLTFYRNTIKDSNYRRSWNAHLDASRNKLELKKDESVLYYKRGK